MSAMRIGVRRWLLLAGLLASVASAAPNRFIQAEALGLHGGGALGAKHPTVWTRVTALKATFVSGRLRAGVSAVDWILSANVMSMVPVHVGYNLLLRPVKTLVGYRFVPACYVEAAVGLRDVNGATFARVTAAAETELLGLGLGAEVGGVYMFGSYFHADSNEPRAYAEVKVRLLTATFGF
jgi:hypothetical protein